MTEQDDLRAQDKQQAEREQGVVAAVDVVTDDAGRQDVTPAPARSTKLWWLLLLLIVLPGAYLLINWPGAAVPTSAPANISPSNKQPMPTRPSSVASPQPQKSEPPPRVAVETAPASQLAGALDPASAAVTTTTGSVVAEPVVVASAIHYFVQIGPFLSKTELATATRQLQALGFAPQETQGRGIVTMTRLLEGRYPEAAARQRLTQLRKTLGEAFILPDGENWALYVGSFSDPARAANAVAQFAENGLKVTLVTSDLERSGSLLTTELTDQAAAHQAAELFKRSGLKPRIVTK